MNMEPSQSTKACVAEPWTPMQAYSVLKLSTRYYNYLI